MWSAAAWGVVAESGNIDEDIAAREVVSTKRRVFAKAL